MQENKNSIDFIGIGAQRTGTSWIYACLYEHPQLCMPFKEIHFFSRERNWKKGIKWYESRFKGCPEDKLKGEFSTSYLYSKVAAQRIYQYYPKTKLIVCLRNPVRRAFSSYRNDIMGNVLPKDKTFEEAISENQDYVNQGFYYKQLQRYFSYFPKEQILILIYEDSKKNPEKFIKSIYSFLGVNESFVPSMLRNTINQARTPRFVLIDRFIFHTASFLRQKGLHKLVWLGKKTGIPEFIRRLNTERKKIEMKEGTKQKLEKLFAKDISELSKLLNRDLSQDWYDYKKYL